MGDTVGHADSRVPEAAKVGVLHPGKLNAGTRKLDPSSPRHPTPASLPSLCPVFIHWQEHNHVPTQNTP